MYPDPPLLINESESKLKSTVIKKNLDPNWGDEKLKIVLNTCDVEGLKRNGHLFFSVWDFDTFVQDMSNEHDLIGNIRRH